MPTPALARLLLAPLLLAGLALPGHAAGDPVQGEKEFTKCRACHTVTAPDGTEIAKGGKTGPNLYGVIGRQAGTTEFRNSPSLVAAGEQGLIWDEASFAAYVTDPGKFLQERLGDGKARSLMSFRLRKGGEDIAAWLASVAPAP